MGRLPQSSAVFRVDNFAGPCLQGAPQRAWIANKNARLTGQ